ncbi:hypothetical protein BH23ACT9_BH23ACT9_00070 [soil metagenome]
MRWAPPVPGTLDHVSTIISLDDPEAALAKAVEALSGGSVVVMPVGGVYAVVADAFRAPATQRIFAARRRSRATPLPVLIRSERQVAGLAGEVPEAADRLMAAYWPGDLTLILRASDGMTWDLGNSLGTVQLRLPSDDFVLRLIGTVGPLACTSANRLDQPRPVTVDEAKQQLGVLVPVYLDGGELDGSVSTIVDATGPSLVVAREGSIPAHHIELVGGGELPWGERPVEPVGSTGEADAPDAGVDDAGDGTTADANAAADDTADAVAGDDATADAVAEDPGEGPRAIEDETALRGDPDEGPTDVPTLTADVELEPDADPRATP